jgi:hypothetical protein
MLEFLRILFFGHVVLITPQPVDLYGTVEFSLEEPVAAITTGATLEVDVSSMIAKPREEPIAAFRQRVDAMFARGAIEATLFGANDVSVHMQYNGNHAYSDTGVTLLLESADDVPTGVEFTRLEVSSQMTLKSVTLSWRNYKH